MSPLPGLHGPFPPPTSPRTLSSTGCSALPAPPSTPIPLGCDCLLSGPHPLLLKQHSFRTKARAHGLHVAFLRFPFSRHPTKTPLLGVTRDQHSIAAAPFLRPRPPDSPPLRTLTPPAFPAASLAAPPGASSSLSASCSPLVLACVCICVRWAWCVHVCLPVCVCTCLCLHPGPCV